MTAPRAAPKPTPTWLGLSAQMFALVILPFAALALAMTLVSLWLHQNAMRSMVAERDTRAVGMAASFLESKIQSEQELASALAMNRELASGADADILSAFVQANDARDKNLALVSGAGEILAFSGKAEVRAALMGKIIQPGQVLTDKIHETHFLWLSATLPKGGLAVNIVALGPLVQGALGEHPHAAAFLVDANGQPLVGLGTMQWDGPLLAHPGVPEALRGESGFSYVNINAGGMEHVVAYSPVGKWALVAEFAPGEHYGLLGMHERVELIGGKLTIESVPGNGALLRVGLAV